MLHFLANEVLVLLRFVLKNDQIQHVGQLERNPPPDTYKHLFQNEFLIVSTDTKGTFSSIS